MQIWTVLFCWQRMLPQELPMSTEKYPIPENRVLGLSFWATTRLNRKKNHKELPRGGLKLPVSPRPIAFPALILLSDSGLQKFIMIRLSVLCCVLFAISASAQRFHLGLTG